MTARGIRCRASRGLHRAVTGHAREFAQLQHSSWAQSSNDLAVKSDAPAPLLEEREAGRSGGISTA
jgi:hypothetical protein